MDGLRPVVPADDRAQIHVAQRLDQRHLGKYFTRSHAVAAVGITESLLTIIYSVAVGLSVGTTAIVSRRIGEKNPEGASRAAGQAILAGFSVSIVISLIGIFLAEDLLRLMGASGEVIKIGHSYTGIMLGGNIVIVLLFIINAIFRSSGDAAVSMRVLWLANIINIILLILYSIITLLSESGMQKGTFEM